MKIALLGNPNTGKSSIFNMLTGLRQHVGNFPGITVDKRVGRFVVEDTSHQLIDFPGVTSLYPNSLDEQVVGRVLLDKSNKSIIDGVKQTSTFLLFFIKWCFNNLCTYFFIPYNNKYIIV